MIFSSRQLRRRTRTRDQDRSLTAASGAPFCSRFFLLCATALFVGGCGSPSEPEELTDQRIREFGSLPGLRTSHHRGLQDELARLESERATPVQLEEDSVRRGDSTASQSPPPDEPAASTEEDDLAVILAAAFPDPMVRLLDQRINKLYPVGRFGFGPVELQKIAAFRREYDAAVEQVLRALDRPDCDFRYEHTRGLLADNSFIDRAWLFQRLQAFQIAEGLAANQPGVTLEPWQYLSQVIDVLARKRSLVTRRAAAELRAEAFLVLAAIVQHPATTRPQLARLFASLNEQLAHWPADRETWIGERAMGMHVYEMIRDGRVKDLLTVDEIAMFAAEGSLEALEAAVIGAADDDELYYLSTMRRLIEAGDQPYYQRKGLLLDIRQNLQKIRQTPEFPTVAARILFENLEDGYRVQAEDRAACEVWALALAEALGEPRPEFEKHPVTGRPYEIVREDSRVVVRGLADEIADHPVIVPLPTAAVKDEGRKIRDAG